MPSINTTFSSPLIAVAVRVAVAVFVPFDAVTVYSPALFVKNVLPVIAVPLILNVQLFVTSCSVPFISTCVTVNVTSSIPLATMLFVESVSVNSSSATASTVIDSELTPSFVA